MVEHFDAQGGRLGQAMIDVYVKAIYDAFLRLKIIFKIIIIGKKNIKIENTTKM